jgi:hypothetical protein
LTVNRSGDESTSTQDPGDHGPISTAPPAKGEPSVAGNYDPRSTQLPALDLLEPKIQTTGQPDWSRVGDRSLDEKPVGAEGAALEHGRDRRDDMETLDFREADVLASCSPFERGGLERAIDRFLEQLSGSDLSVLPGLVPSSNMVPGVVVVVGALLAMETLRRRGRNDRDGAGTDNQAEGVEHSGFPGLPGRRRIWLLEEP